MKCWRSPFIISNNNRFRWLRLTLRPNIILRGHCYYQSSIRSPLYRQHSRSMNLRGLLSRQCNPYSVFRISLPSPLYHCSHKPYPPTVPTRARRKQPSWPKLRCRQNPLPPLFLLQRPPGIRNPLNSTYLPSTVLS